MDESKNYYGWLFNAHSSIQLICLLFSPILISNNGVVLGILEMGFVVKALTADTGIYKAPEVKRLPVNLEAHKDQQHIVVSSCKELADLELGVGMFTVTKQKVPALKIHQISLWQLKTRSKQKKWSSLSASHSLLNYLLYKSIVCK